MVIENYLEQHVKIKTQIGVIKKLAIENTLKENAVKIGTEISRLAGIINIHLSSEDKFMYPKMIASENVKVKNTAMVYQNEMGNLLKVFTAFKEKYNTKPKIIENERFFTADLKEIVAQLLTRMNKEEQELYKLL